MILRSTGCTVPLAPVPAEFAVPPQALRATVAPSARNAIRLSPCMDRFSSLNRYFAADSTGSPFDEPVFERADQPLRDQREHRQQEHAREHPVDVEGVARVVDELAEACRCPEELADDSADDGQAETDGEAGQK